MSNSIQLELIRSLTFKGTKIETSAYSAARFRSLSWRYHLGMRITPLLGPVLSKSCKSLFVPDWLCFILGERLPYRWVPAPTSHYRLQRRLASRRAVPELKVPSKVEKSKDCTCLCELRGCDLVWEKETVEAADLPAKKQQHQGMGHLGKYLEAFTFHVRLQQ